MSSFTLLGVAHLLPLPGTPSSTFDLDSITRRALDDIRVLHDAGFQGAVLENFGDAPFRAGTVSPHIVAMMSVIAYQIRASFPKNFQLGINVLRNDARAAMAVASSINADFIRVNVHIGAAWTDQGLIEGTAYETLQYKNQLRSSVKIAADVLVKHAAPAGVSDIEILAKDTYFRGKAQTLIVTGSRTGGVATLDDVKAVRRAVPTAELWIGSGINPNNIGEYSMLADGAIVGSYLHRDGDLEAPLCEKRARYLIQNVGGER